VAGIDVDAIDERVLSAFAAGTSDARRRDEVVAAAYPLVEQLARRFAGRGEPLEDLIQVASVGLLKATRRFEPERGVPFSQYATPTILGELKRYFRDSGWALRVPRRLQERVLLLRGVVEEMTQELGRAPTAGEIAERAGIGIEDVLDGLEAAAGYSPESLDGAPGQEGSALRVGTEDGAFEFAEQWADVAEHLRNLDARSRVILDLRFVKGLTQSQIGREVGLSQMQVSRILRSTLDRLRALSRER